MLCIWSRKGCPSPLFGPGMLGQHALYVEQQGWPLSAVWPWHGPALPQSQNWLDRRYAHGVRMPCSSPAHKMCKPAARACKPQLRRRLGAELRPPQAAQRPTLLRRLLCRASRRRPAGLLSLEALQTPRAPILSRGTACLHAWGAGGEGGRSVGVRPSPGLAAQSAAAQGERREVQCCREVPAAAKRASRVVKCRREMPAATKGASRWNPCI